jgi:hypothetical protein
MPVPFQYPHQFRAAVAAKTDNSNWELHFV